MRHILNRYDADASGHLEQSELAHMCKSICALVQFTPDEAARFASKCALMDADRDGEVSFSEFSQCIVSEPRLLSLFTAKINALADSELAAQISSSESKSSCSLM